MSTAAEFGLVDALIGLRREEVGDTVVGHVPVSDHTRSAAGGLRTGVLISAVDAVGGLACGLSVLPAWIVSTNLMVMVARLDHVGPLRLEGRLLRRGRSAGVAAVEVRDAGAGDRPVAHGILTAAVLDPEAGPPPLERPVRFTPPPFVGSRPNVERSFAIDAGEGPTTTLQLGDDLRNRWGILHGGVIAVLVDVAATRAAPGGVAGDTVLHFLRPARTGPVEARATSARGRAGTTIVTVSVHDVGQDDRRVALASVAVRATAE
jgi:acyl-coenzyme A thioesterase PaaI-like protein